MNNFSHDGLKNENNCMNQEENPHGLNDTFIQLIKKNRLSRKNKNVPFFGPQKPYQDNSCRVHTRAMRQI